MDKWKELIPQQLELYSNAIVGFAVIQSLTYVYYFGTSKDFACHVKTEIFLAEALTLSFLIVSVFAVLAVRSLGKTQSSSAGEYAPVVRKVYRAKMAIVAFFYLMPLMVTFFYGVMKPPCE